MKEEKVGIITINDFKNYGNRLQNYALQEIIKKLNYECYTIRNIPQLNEKKKFLLRYCKYILIKRIHKRKINEYFADFNKNINFTKGFITPYNNKKFKFKKFITGSDQVWNPRFERLRYIDLLDFATKQQKISYAASFGISNLNDNEINIVKQSLSIDSFKHISVREEAGKEIIEKITGRKDIKVVLDPTLLLSKDEWKKVEKKPNHMTTKKYILTYFIGQNVLNEYISKIASKNNWEVINIKIDNNDCECKYGPSEFLYLFRNAELVFTDSFHACVFSIIYERKFFVINRVEKNIENMSSRIDTLLKTFSLETRKITDFEKIDINISSNIDYSKVKKALEKRKKESINCLKTYIED